jgi:hypothetical protein
VLRQKPMMWTLASALFSMSLLPLSAFGTTIVALLGEKTITIAADGIGVSNPKKNGDIARKPVCKILCKDLVCFAAAGRLNDGKYNVLKLAWKELDNPGAPKELSGRFKTVIAPLLSTMLQAEKKEAPNRYKKYIDEGVPMLSYLFAGFSNDGKPQLINSSAGLDPKGNILPINELPYVGEAGQLGLLSKGKHKYIDEYKNRNPKWRESAVKHPTEFVEQMVHIEIQASENDGSRDVGEPISIVSLTKKDGQFKVGRIGNCQ